MQKYQQYEKDGSCAGQRCLVGKLYDTHKQKPKNLDHKKLKYRVKSSESESEHETIHTCNNRSTN